VPNIVKITVENPDEILNAGAYGANSIVRLQTAATEVGAFADVAGTGSTPTVPIVTLIRAYTGYDPNGIATSWYRTRYENVGGTRVSDWSAAFQADGEEAGYICSLYDVKQRLAIAAMDTTDDETLIDYISAVTNLVVTHTGRRFVRSPLAGSSTFLLDVKRPTKTLWVPGGIAALALVEVATQTGGSYGALAPTDWFLRPRVTDSDYVGAATRIELIDLPVGGLPLFYPGYDVVRLTGALGFPAVPPYVGNLSANAVVRMFRAKQSPGAGVDLVVGSPEFGQRVLAAMSPAERAWLDEIRIRRA
jgi:hypothetical protein